MEKFAISEVLPGRLNALVKNLMFQMNIDDPNEAVRRVNAYEWEVVAATLLELVGTVQIPATSKSVASDHFTTNNREGVKFWGFGSNFQQYFLAKVEESQDAITLRYSRLKKSSQDAPIRKELGSEKEETTPATIWELLKKQSDGKSGVLLNNGLANIFYVRDVKGVLRAVSVIWRSVGWSVYAFLVEDPDGWIEGDQVFSRNS